MLRNRRRWMALILALCALCAPARAEAGIPDGVYAPDAFTFAGGSGRVTLSCPEVRVSGGEVRATLVFSSPNYTALTLDGARYLPVRDGETSAFDVQVPLNRAFEVVGTTVAMSAPHDIAYTLCIALGAGAGSSADPEGGESAEPNDGAPTGPKGDEPADPEGDEPAFDGGEAAPADAGLPAAPAAIGGRAWERRAALQYAHGFAVDWYEDGLALIRIAGGETVLSLPEGMDAPADAPAGAVVLRRPIRGIYLAATSAMALFDRLGALDAVGLSALPAESWHVAAARAAMEAGEIAFAGKYSEPDYELLVRSGCPLAIESTMIQHAPKVREMIEQLGIPVIVDRSSYEEHPLGRTEWIRLYGALLGREEAAEAFFAEKAALAKAWADQPSTGKRVAFFYVSTDGSVVVRGAGDYVARMIALAGGRYALAEIAPGARASVAVTMEQFYAAAVDADFLVYNAAIAGAPDSLEALCGLSALFRDFRAVREGRVWCTGKDLYQETDDVAELIADFRAMLTGGGGMRFLQPLN